MKRFIIGIISWLPDDDRRADREQRLQSLISRCDEIFKDIQIVIVAQNWNNFKLNDSSAKIDVIKYDRLGIVKARETLRQELLKRDFDYAILLDDDAIIYGDDYEGFLNHFNQYSDGYCFRYYREFKNYLPERYVPACLNLCVISKRILERFAFDLRFDPQTKVAFEDNVYPIMMYCTIPQLEIPWPIGTLFTSYKSGQGNVRSTWSETGDSIAWRSLWENNLDVVEYIKQFKEYPEFQQNEYTKRIAIYRNGLKWSRNM